MDIFLVVVIIGLPALAQLFYSINYKKYNKIQNKVNIIGSDVAKTILIQSGLEYVDIVEVPKELNDKYDVNKKIINLSSNTYKGNSISSIAIATHECMHAVQDVKGNIVLKINALLDPIMKIITKFSYWVVIAGFVLHWDNLMYAGIGFTMIALIFYLISLSVEFDASKKALINLKKFNIIANEDSEKYKKVLNALCFKSIGNTLMSSMSLFNLILVSDEKKDVDNK